MPYSVIVGRLHAVDGNYIVIGGGVRILMAPGVEIPDVPLGTSLTVVIVDRGGVLLGETIRQTPDANPFGGRPVKP